MCTFAQILFFSDDVLISMSNTTNFVLNSLVCTRVNAVTLNL